MVWNDALFRFGDSDNLALKIPNWDAAQDAMSGSVLAQSVNTGVVRYIANVEQPQQTIQLTVRTNAEQGYVSEIYAGTDQYLNLWAA